MRLSKVCLVEYFFGAVEENRIAYQSGRDLTLNPPKVVIN